MTLSNWISTKPTIRLARTIPLQLALFHCQGIACRSRFPPARNFINAATDSRSRHLESAVFRFIVRPWSRPSRRDQSVSAASSFPNSLEVAEALSLAWQARVLDWITSEEASVPNKHLVAQNYYNFYSSVRGLLPGTSFVNFRYAYPEAVLSNYARAPPLLMTKLEPGPRGRRLPPPSLESRARRRERFRSPRLFHQPRTPGWLGHRAKRPRRRQPCTPPAASNFERLSALVFSRRPATPFPNHPACSRGYPSGPF